MSDLSGGSRRKTPDFRGLFYQGARSTSAAFSAFQSRLLNSL
jgi:hypothetical protein